MRAYSIVRGVSAFHATAFGMLALLTCCSEAKKYPSCSERKNKVTTILFTGDVMLGRGVAAQMQCHGYDYPWRGVDSLFHTADAVVVNLECPVTERHEPVNKQYVFRASPQSLPAMARAGVTHATLANNHTMDHGHGGLADTDRLLRLNGITPIGLGPVPQAVFLTDDVAVMSVIMMPVENWVFADSYTGICCTSTDSLATAVQRFKSTHDKVRLVLCLHWGAEYQPHCTARQMMDAHHLIDVGADAIVGHHPHVIQNCETYRGRPICYSLGNFIFDNRRPETWTTAVLALCFTPDGVSSSLHHAQSHDCQPLLED